MADPVNDFVPLILDNIGHGIFTIDAEGVITSFNRKAEQVTGWRREDAIGMPCHEVFQADLCGEACLLKRSIRTGERIEEKDILITARSGRKIPVSVSTAALVEQDGTVRGGVEMFRDVTLEHELRRQIDGSYQLENLVSKSRAMRKVFQVLPLLARSESTVLIEGESGTGKEVVARAIHDGGSRRDKPFVAVNCGALPDTLLESELFGYRKGAFTDAKTDKPGRFAMAEGGTILLDEIGDLSLPMQAKLLRVLQTRSYEPLGGTKTQQADVRILAATNQELAEEVRRKRFRQDLYFRLNVVRLSLPRLVDRREDLPLLVQHFLEHFNALQGRRIRRLTESAMAALMAYDYPGNVRELENAIEHGFVVCAGDLIHLDDLPAHIVEAVGERARKAGLASKPLKLAEAELIRETLARHAGHRQRAADELGISRNTLWRKMKRYDLL